MSGLEALVYVSSAVKELSADEIDHLLTRARERNREYGVTGVLLYIDGTFMQYIEGLVAELDLIYRIIVEDPLHTGIIKLLHQSIKEREFTDWSMAYCTREKTVLVGLCNDGKILDGKLGIASYQQTPARILLHGFWVKGDR